VLSGRAAAQHDDVVVVAHGDLRCLFVRGSASRLSALVEPVESLDDAPVFDTATSSMSRGELTVMQSTAQG
jgi:hypothetical protein